MTNAGTIGDTFAAMIRDELNNRNELEQRIIAHRIQSAIKAWAKAGETPSYPVAPMTDQEAIAFERESMEFGKHAGQPVKDVPLEYLTWLADSSRRTWRQLHAYLNSRRVETELASESKGEL